MTDAEMKQAVRTLLRRQERKFAWLVFPPVVIAAFLVGLYFNDYQVPLPPTPTASLDKTRKLSLVVDPHTVEDVPFHELETPGPLRPIRRKEDPKDWPRGIPPGGIPSERPRGLTQDELKRWAERQEERERLRALYPGLPPDN